MAHKSTLYIHIGHSKAGSTTLQKFIQQNLEHFRRGGIFPSDSKLNFSACEPVTMPPTGFLEKLALNDMSQSQALVRSKILQALDKTSGQSLLVSAENLSNLNREKLFQTVTDLVEIKVIYYVRRKDDWLASVWKQWNVKTGIDLKSFVRRDLKKPRFVFRSAIERWQSLVEPGNIKVAPLHQCGLVQGSILADFTEALGMDFSVMARVENANSSFDVEKLWMLGQCEGLFDTIRDHRIYDLIDLYGKDLFKTHSIDPLGYKLRREVFGAYEEEYHWLHSEFFPHVTINDIFGLNGYDEDGEGISPTVTNAGPDTLLAMTKLALRQHQKLKELEAEIDLINRSSRE